MAKVKDRERILKVGRGRQSIVIYKVASVRLSTYFSTENFRTERIGIKY